MLYDFLQVDDLLLDSRSRSLARLLTAAGKRTSQGDALILVLRLIRYVVRNARETAPDLKAELRRAALLDDAGSMEALLDAAEGWPAAKMRAVRDALAAPTVGVLEALPDGAWRVVGVAERYGRFAEKRRDSRGRAEASRLARERGWKSSDGGGWHNTQTGETVESWRELMVRLGDES